MSESKPTSDAFSAISWNQQTFPTYVASILPLEAALLSIIVERFNHDNQNPLTIPIDAVERQFQTPAESEKEVKLAVKTLRDLQLTQANGTGITLIPHLANNLKKQELVVDLNPAAFDVLTAVDHHFPSFGTATWRNLESRHSQLSYLFVQDQGQEHGQVTVTRQQLADQFGINIVIPDRMLTGLVAPKIKGEFMSNGWFPYFQLTVDQTTDPASYQIKW